MPILHPIFREMEQMPQQILKIPHIPESASHLSFRFFRITNPETQFLMKMTLIFLLIIWTINTSPQEDGKETSLGEVVLSQIDFTKSYVLESEEYGTKTEVTIKKNKRIMTTNALPNHETGKFPNQGNPNSIRAQKQTYEFPLQPKFSGESKWAREPGIAVNGIKFEPETAERFVCETGEVYRIEAFQELVDLGMDFNNAHVQPTGAYHYHGVPESLIKGLDQGKDLILVGYAKDGFPMYYSKSGKYKPSYQLAEDPRTGELCNYRNPKQGMTKELDGTSADGTFVSDWDYIANLGDLDECNGTYLEGEYVYFITEEYPYVGRCLKGTFTERGPQGPPPGGGRGRPPRRF